MATLLDQIIDGSSDESMKTPDLLRKVQVAATRIGAPGVVAWVKQELQGYPDDAELPDYRKMATSVMGHFTGPMQSQIKKQLPPYPGFEDDFTIDMRQPLITLQSFAESDEDAQVQWPAWRVRQYEETGAFAIQFHGLFGAWNVVTRQSLLGVIDTVRSKAMEFALELQESFPDAGSMDGPSVAKNTAVAPVVFNTTNNIYGHGANIATGSDIAQKSIIKGNLEELGRQVRALGLNDAEVTEFTAIIEEEKSVDKPRGKAFLEKVRAGSVAVGAAVPSNVIAGSLIELAKMYLGVS
ncbi:hypothetical protein [Leucobacter luti]|uniref:AbiTii domain-containing protein n=1 Tax=Leucobacter luti TaxID=340320 RepID=UPI001C6937A2|nr:hypothetical protein [Leucobacter luti]QYM76465.1 hypothetical protein K1X41_03170 [Leucobacter luti]